MQVEENQGQLDSPGLPGNRPLNRRWGGRPYHEIILTFVLHISHDEWTVITSSLQLAGARQRPAGTPRNALPKQQRPRRSSIRRPTAVASQLAASLEVQQQRYGVTYIIRLRGDRTTLSRVRQPTAQPHADDR